MRQRLPFVIEHRRLGPTHTERARERLAERQLLQAPPPKPKRRRSRLVGMAPRGTVLSNLSGTGSRCRIEAREEGGD